MRSQLYRRLCAIARRDCGEEAEDVVQEALLAAVRAGRVDLNDPGTARWLTGVVRNQARMAVRGSSRRRHRETDWMQAADDGAAEAVAPIEPILAGLSPALRAVALLALTGHNRREIAYLLRLDDAALRRRIADLKAKLSEAGVELPPGMPGLNLDLSYGRIRDALLPQLLRQGGVFASHDPDGHLFVVRRSRNP
jgi:RNA polymerase sigma-70 factor (ECF subfamily)